MKRLIYLLIILFISCYNPVETRLNKSIELKQIKLLSYKAIDTDTIALEFNDKINIKKLEVINHPIKYYEIKDNVVVIYLSKIIYLDSSTFINGTVEDSNSNLLTFSVPVKGFNTNIAQVLISEIRVKSSKKRPDSVELYITRNGNLSGTSLYLGIPSNYKEKYTFGDYYVKRGEIIVIKIGKGPNEYFKTYDMPNLPGLSSTMGVLTVVDQNGKLLDAVFYSNRGLDSDDGYNGLYSEKFKSQVDYIYLNNGWNSNVVTSSIDPSSSTPTKTIARINSLEDTNSKDDWYIKDKGKCNFGYLNIE